VVVTKKKTVKYPLVPVFVAWYAQLKGRDVDDEAWVFPRYHHFSRQFLFKGQKPLTTSRFNQILQRLDSTMSSCMFRYGVTENLLRRGYSTRELKEIGDWENSLMPEIYARRLGLSEAEKKFAADTRMR
jgi:hypothetical protein